MAILAAYLITLCNKTMLNKIKLHLLPIIIIFLFSCILVTKAETKTYYVQKIDIEKIKVKEDFYKNLFNPKRKLKKAAIVSTGILSTMVLTYAGFKYFTNRISDKEKPKETTDKSFNKLSSKIDLEELLKQATVNNFQEHFERNENAVQAGKHGFYKGIRKGITTGIVSFISIGVLYVVSDILTPLKDSLISFFRSNDEEHFNRINLNLSSSLKQLQELLTLENGICYKEEIVDYYNFFVENVENFLAIISAISTKQIKSPGNYQSIKKGQSLTYKHVLKFSEILNKTLNKSDNMFFDETLADQIFEMFKQLNNQIFRFINLSNAVIYES